MIEEVIIGSEPTSIDIDNTNGKIYWTDSGTDKIYIANLDGSGVEEIVSVTNPAAIAIDIHGNTLYFATSGVTFDTIYCRPLGSGTSTALVTGLQRVMGIAVDITEQKIYWTDIFAYKIQRANTDGSDIEDIISDTISNGIEIY